MEEGRNSAFYTNLSKGEYVFQVKATDKNGLWSDKVTEFTIHRLPAFYETWWAYTLYVLIAIGILWTMLHLYLQRIKQENNRMLVERERMQIRPEISKVQAKAGSISDIGFVSSDEQLIEKALRIVEEHMSDPKLDVVMLADKLNVSRSTLSRKIKAMTGQTPLDFIKDIKMRHACRMLENKTVTIAEVVMALGYSDHKHFTTSFKDCLLYTSPSPRD